MLTKDIYLNVMNAIQPAEELGGPDVKGYIELMNEIKRDIEFRIENAQREAEREEKKDHDQINVLRLYDDIQKIDGSIEIGTTTASDAGLDPDDGHPHYVLVYSHQHMAITDPFTDIDGMNAVDPAEAYNIPLSVALIMRSWNKVILS